MTNNVSEANAINMHMRTMNYAMMIGKTAAIDEIVEENKYPIEEHILNYYDW